MPCSLLDDRSRRVGRDRVRDTVCTLLAYGYSLEHQNQEQSMSQSLLISLISNNSVNVISLFAVVPKLHLAWPLSDAKQK